MVLKLFEIQEQLMTDSFLIKLTHFRKTGSINKIFVSLVNLIIKLNVRN